MDRIFKNALLRNCEKRPLSVKSRPKNFGAGLPKSSHLSGPLPVDQGGDPLSEAKDAVNAQ